MNDNFELSILDSGNPSQVIAVARQGCNLAIETLSCHELDLLIKFRYQLANASTGGQRPTVQELQKFGESLFNFTVQKNILKIYHSLPNSHISLQVYSNRADLQALPWEYIQQPGGTNGPDANRSVIRIVPTIGVDMPDIIKFGNNLRMLFVHAEPINPSLGPVAWLDIKESIEREFQAYLQNLTKKFDFELDVVDGASCKSLFDALDVKDYDILHFAGHGEVGPDGFGRLLLQDRKTKKIESILAADLGVLLKNKNLRLVFLSACSTSCGDFAKEFAVIAKTLVEYGIPAVVANQFPVTNSIAAAFAGGFYGKLLRTGDVDQATTNGRIALAFAPSMSGGAAHFEWGIPTLYRHIGANKMFQV